MPKRNKIDCHCVECKAIKAEERYNLDLGILFTMCLCVLGYMLLFA